MKGPKSPWKVVQRFGDDHVGPIPCKLLDSDLRIILISDTHNVETHESFFPDGDLLLHGGDHTIAGTRDELRRASEWLKKVSQKFRFGVCCVGGNHDIPLDRESFLLWKDASKVTDAPMGEPLGNWTEEQLIVTEQQFPNLLNHELVSIAGLTIFGSPFVPLTPSRQKLSADDPLRFLGFNRSDASLEQLYSVIPDGIDVLITHTPPHGILDLSVQYGGIERAIAISIGSTVLARQIQRIKPLIHLFGHEHDCRGMKEHDGTVFVNGSAVDGDRGVLSKGGHYQQKPNFRPFVIDLRKE